MNFANYRNIQADIDTPEFNRDVERVIDFVKEARADKARGFFIGNGGSASTAAHFTNDFQKVAKLPCVSLNDTSTITALANDIEYKCIFSEQLNMHGRPGDILFAISASGNSPNIVYSAIDAKARGMTVVTLSGFQPTNQLRTIGHINFYVPAREYGLVEATHFTILHYILDRVKHA